MLRSVERGVWARMVDVQEALSGSRFKHSKAVSIAYARSGEGSSSSSSSALSLPVSADATERRFSSARLCEADERHVFGPVPSKDEVENAVSALQQVSFPVAFQQVAAGRLPCPSENEATEQVTGSTDLMCKVPTAETKHDRVEPALNLYSQEMLRFGGCSKVLGAFGMLQRNPSIKRMVVSISTDKAVWNAVLNNEAVQEFRQSFYTDFLGSVENDQKHPDESPGIPTRVLRWILDSAKLNIFELMSKIVDFMKDLFRPPGKGKKEMDLFDDALGSSLFLSVVVFLLVVGSRLLPRI